VTCDACGERIKAARLFASTRPAGCFIDQLAQLPRERTADHHIVGIPLLLKKLAEFDRGAAPAASGQFKRPFERGYVRGRHVQSSWQHPDQQQRSSFLFVPRRGEGGP
jgi:hypothetical protein